MELTDRERQVIAEMERRLEPDAPRRAVRRQGRWRPQWTVLPAAVLGVLLLAAGVVLEVGDAVLLGAAFIVWWLSPLLGKLLRAAGRSLLESFQNAPPGPGV